MSLHGTVSTASPLCLSAASRKGHSFYSPFACCASASSGTPDSQPSAGNSAPVDTSGEYKTPYKTLCPRWQEAKDRAVVKTATIQGTIHRLQTNVSRGALHIMFKECSLYCHILQTHTQKKSSKSQQAWDKSTSHSRVKLPRNRKKRLIVLQKALPIPKVYKT